MRSLILAIVCAGLVPAQQRATITGKVTDVAGKATLAHFI
jgi:hypothetical protein